MPESNRRPVSWPVLLPGLAGLLVVVLLPWWRHHAYIRDLYDYGLVIAGVGRLEAGERPYVDFVTPIQSALFLLNWAAERLGGGTFQGMVRGAAVFSVLVTAGLAWAYSRRWPATGALVVAGAVACGSAAQHTLIWHNTVGVACLALVAWQGARAARPDGGWAWMLVAAGLWLGGMNKLNFHLVALAVACGWTLRAGWTGGLGARFVGVQLGLWVLAGIVLPVATELAWSGATWSQWGYNVVALPFGHRSGELAHLLERGFLLRSPHDYYGAPTLPGAGFLLLGWPLVAVLAGWRGCRGRDRVLLLAGALVAAGSAVALLATNFEISHVAVAACLALVAALWAGFDLPARGAWFWAGLVAPAALAGGAAWGSAWLGQRSQFGHSSAARADYRPLETAAPVFTYLRGTHVPPEMHQSLGLAAQWLPQPEGDGRRRVFYGPGIEWLDRVLPSRHHPGLPLWMHQGTSFGPREEHRLARLVGGEGVFLEMYSPVAWAHWPPPVNFEVQRYYDQDLLGPVIKRWVRVDRLRPAVRHALEFIHLFGGNVRATDLGSQEEPLGPQRSADGRLFLGVDRGKGVLTLFAPTLRLTGEVVVSRTEGPAGEAVTVEFSAAQRSSVPVPPRWRQQVELPAGQAQVVAPFALDAGGTQVDFTVVVPAAAAAKVAAGYRELRITHVGQEPGPAPRLRPETPEADDPFDPAVRAALLPAGWEPAEIVVRHGRATPEGLELAAGGEVWVRAEGVLAEFAGELAVPADAAVGAVCRVIWAKAARVEVVEQGGVSRGERRPFRLWSAEPDGWFGVINDQGPGGAPLRVRVQRVQPAG